MSAPLRQPVDATHDARCRGLLRTMNGIVLVEDGESYQASGGPAPRQSEDPTLWIVLGVAGGVVVTAIVIGAVAAASSGPRDATFGAPIVIGW